MTKEHLQKNLSINDEFYKSHPKAYEYALKMVEREVHQAVEAMAHNLNTLQSRWILASFNSNIDETTGQNRGTLNLNKQANTEVNFKMTQGLKSP